MAHLVPSMQMVLDVSLKKNKNKKSSDLTSTKVSDNGLSLGSCLAPLSLHQHLPPPPGMKVTYKSNVIYRRNGDTI